MPFGAKTNERPGTRAEVKYARMSAYKARVVLDLIRGKEVADADAILEFAERDAAIVVRKCLASAIANAEHNDQLDAENLYVSACFADEGPTLKRWRPRARGRATRIRKRTCHITVIVSQLPPELLERRRQREAAAPTVAAGRRRTARASADARRARVAKSREREAAAEEHDHEGHDHDHEHDHEHDEEVTDEIGEGVVETADNAEQEPAEGSAETVDAALEADDAAKEEE
jgi:large subunit ribosomal protein L22